MSETGSTALVLLFNGQDTGADAEIPLLVQRINGSDSSLKPTAPTADTGATQNRQRLHQLHQRGFDG